MKKRNPLDVLASLLPHLNIALALFFITCFIVDRYNRAMAFINNEYTKYGLLVFAILVIVESVIFVLRDRKARGGTDSRPGGDESGQNDKKGNGPC